MEMHYQNEGTTLDDAGRGLSVLHVDMRDPECRVPIGTLVKASRREHAIGEVGTVRVSKPSRFRDSGEGLITDPSETLVSRRVMTSERVDDPADLREARRFNEELGMAATAIGKRFRFRTNGTRKTTSRMQHLTLGRNGWLFSTSIEPADGEEHRRWRAALSDDYTHVEYIRRPREFARALGQMAIEQLGPRGKDATIKSALDDSRIESVHRSQVIVHGPVIYTENPFGLSVGAASRGEQLLLPVFVKHIQYAEQREYRFLIWAEEEPDEGFVDLVVSKAMLGSLEAWHPPVVARNALGGGAPGAEERHAAPPTSEQIREAEAHENAVPALTLRRVDTADERGLPDRTPRTENARRRRVRRRSRGSSGRGGGAGHDA